MHWLLDEGSLKVTPSLALGTVDSWILWNLTNGVFATDLSNASRTMLCDIDTGQWSPELCDLFGVPLDSLAEIKPSCGRFGRVAHLELGALHGVPISGILGDQQAALFGQACFAPGMVKATYGTGAFVVLQAGTTRPPISEGLLTTVAWNLGEGSGVSYAIEGSAFVAGAAIQWLRDELGILGDASEIEPLARSVSGSDGLSFIPAFVGLGSPWWDESARGALVGITRGSNRAALANAVIDAMAFEVRAITDAMQTVAQDSLVELRADGGAAVMDLLLERQANQSRLDVARPISLDTTARGAATIAGLAEGVFESLEQLSSLWHVHSRFSPSRDAAGADAAYAVWLHALEKTRDWVR
jgi:glycerol kinase